MVAAAVVAHLDDEKVAARVRGSGDYLGSQLWQLARKHAVSLCSVRGRGLLWALQFGDDDTVARMTRACLDRGLMVTPTRGAVVRLLPSLLVSRAEIDTVVAALDRALAATVPAPEIALDCNAKPKQQGLFRAGSGSTK